MEEGLGSLCNVALNSSKDIELSSKDIVLSSKDILLSSKDYAKDDILLSLERNLSCLVDNQFTGPFHISIIMIIPFCC